MPPQLEKNHVVPTACPTLCDPTDSSPPGSAVPGILQARILEWVAISFSYIYMCVRWARLAQARAASRPGLGAIAPGRRVGAPPLWQLIGEGNGNPLQCSCLKNPRDGRAWWAAVYGVAWPEGGRRGFIHPAPRIKPPSPPAGVVEELIKNLLASPDG